MVAECFFKLLGWATSEEKDAGFLSIASVLGVCVDLSHTRRGIISTYNTEARKLKLVNSIDGLLERGRFGKGELATLRGRFFCSLKFRSLAKAVQFLLRLCRSRLSLILVGPLTKNFPLF